MPTIKVLKIDETDGWTDEEILAVARRIFGVYVFDAERRVHCCEWTPSYELHFVVSQPEFFAELSEEDHDDILDLIHEVDRHSAYYVRYMHCHEVDSLPECQEGDLLKAKAGIYVLDGIESEESDDAIDEAVTYGRSNSL